MGNWANHSRVGVSFFRAFNNVILNKIGRVERQKVRCYISFPESFKRNDSIRT